jgi:hypothetical protein
LVNQKYYAEVLCVNKNKQNSCCKGKCALEKELVNLNENDSEKKSKSPVLKLDKIGEFLVSIPADYFCSLFGSESFLNKKFNILIGINFIVKKPPIC